MALQISRAVVTRDGPKLQISINSSTSVRGNYHSHTEYDIDVSQGEQKWKVQKRYREFLALHKQLKSVPGFQPPAMPEKGLFGFRHQCNIGDFNKDRQQDLEEYLNALLAEVSSLSDVSVLKSFLEEANAIDVDDKPQCCDIFNHIDPEEKFGLPKPIFMIPQKDIVDGDNGITEVAFGESEVVNGVEVTVIFKDEDRPNHMEDIVYDAIRKPLFGRTEDIETFTFVRGEDGAFHTILFKGTYSGDEQDWSCKAPKHMTEEVSIADFSKDGDRTLIWVNVWNHLFGRKNNNPNMEMQRVEDYPCTSGTRAKVDSRYKGMVTTLA